MPPSTAQPHPSPEIPQCDATPEQTPRTAARLADRGVQHGWQVRSTFARGTTLDAYGAPGRVVNSLVVRLAKPPLRAVGIWHDGKFSCALLRVDGVRGTAGLGSRELTALVVAK